MAFLLKATKRVLQGTGASRRLRREGQLPGVVYGGVNEAQPITLDHNELYHMLRNEAFHSSLLVMEIEGVKETVVLRDVQWHPFRQLVLHLDFQRINAKEKIHMRVPLHFINADIAPGVKLGSGIVSHVMTDVEIQCLPADLPEFIEVDLKDLEVGQSVHVSQLVLPKGVELVAHNDADPVVAVVTLPRGALATEETAADAAPAA